MSYQDIIDSCENVWDANKGDCNHFVKAVAEQLGVTAFAAGDNADAICDKLAAAGDWTSTTNLVVVEQNASAGQFIIAGLKAADFTPPRNNGHVAVVVKGDDVAHPGYPLAYWGKLGGAGEKDKSIRLSFIPDIDLPNVTYFCKVLSSVSSEMAFDGAFRPATDDLSSAQRTIQLLIGDIVQKLGSGSGAVDARILFPNGIEMIDVQVKAGPVDIHIKLAGPKAS